MKNPILIVISLLTITNYKKLFKTNRFFACIILITLCYKGNTQTYNITTGTVAACSGTFYDDGGPSANYSWGQTIKQTFISATGSCLKFDFTTMNVQNSAALSVYDGPNDTYPLIGIYGTSTVSIQSTGTALTFVFTGPSASNIIRYQGWEANISCTTPTLTPYVMTTGTVNTCSGVFFDPAGPSANYTNNNSVIQTFASGSSQFINFTFTNFNLLIGDTLFAYDGNLTTSPLIGAYTGNSLPERISSLTGNSITFNFKSNASGVSSGWKALIDCSASPTPETLFTMQNGVRYICSGTFYDDGGPSVNYGWGQTIKQTFISSSGTKLKFDFTTMNVQNSAFLSVYDGPNDTYPLIGSYGTSSVSIQSTGTALTFVFTGPSAANIVRYAGWEAAISCTSITLIPIANYTVPIICNGNCVNFSDASTQSPTSWLWSFQGASVATSTLQNPTNICYNSAGTYTTSLTASNTAGSSVSIQTITVLSTPTLSITSSNTLSCSGQNVVLTALGANTYTWNNSATTNSIIVSPITTTTYNVLGMLGNGCSNTLSFIQNVNTCTGIDTKTDLTDSNVILPNPFNDIIFIKHQNPINVKIINSLGQIVLSQLLINEDNIETRALPLGIYCIELKESEQRYSIIKVIKQ